MTTIEIIAAVAVAVLAGGAYLRWALRPVRGADWLGVKIGKQIGRRRADSDRPNLRHCVTWAVAPAGARC